jgi:outer membrane protein OmpA-like peptidoglycan-associated protein/tetratricopeptide (TPR) repeat protein
MKSKYIILFLAILMGVTNQINAQSVKKADKRVTFYEYAVAIPMLEKIIEKNGEGKEEAMVMLADCYRSVNNEQKATELYAQIMEFDHIDPINHYYYGQTLRTLGRYDEAKEQFLLYAELVPDDPRGALFAAYSDEIQNWIKKDDAYEIHHIASINSENADFSPIIFDDGVVFSSDRKLKKYLNPTYDWTGEPYLNFFYAKADTNAPVYDPSYFEAEGFSSKLNDLYHDGTAVLNSTGDVIYFTRTEKEKVARDNDNLVTNKLKLFSSEFTDGKWSKPVELDLNNEAYSVGHPALSPDDQMLYFVSDMPGGIGGTDLYVSKWTGDGWGEPKNLGTTINTFENEMFPYIHEDGTLYFASSGHLGYGGLDIFRSTRENGTWSEPINMMAPMNSSYDDFGLAFMPGTSVGLFSSDRPGGLGKDDIYAFESMVKVEGKVLGCADAGIDCVPLENATIFVLNKKTNEVTVLKTDAAGRYELVVSPRNEYAIKATKTGYFSDGTSIKTQNKYFPIRDLMLEKHKEGKVFTVNNIYYDFDKWFIREDAKPALDNLVRIMQENPITVELSSHTDCRGSDAYNMKLSQKRAQAAVDYIIEHGVDAARITAKGYGESMPVNDCVDGATCTEDEYQANRRTEFKIISVTPEPPPQEIDESKYQNGEVYHKSVFSREFFEGCNFSEPLDN